MPTFAEYRAQSFAERIERLERTPSQLAVAIEGYGVAELARRPDARNWCATEVICHLRDIEELFMLRFHMMLGTDEPTFLVLGELPPNPLRWGIEGEIGMPLDPDRWPEERQYRRNDPGQALSALGNRRKESLALLRKLTPAERQRGSIHVTLGPMTFEDWTALIAAHDDKHLAQLERALRGRA